MSDDSKYTLYQEKCLEIQKEDDIRFAAIVDGDGQIVRVFKDTHVRGASHSAGARVSDSPVRLSLSDTGSWRRLHRRVAERTGSGWTFGCRPV